VKAAIGAASRKRDAIMSNADQLASTFDTDANLKTHAASPTAHLLDEIARYGHRFGRDEPDPRPLPEPQAAQAHLDAMVDALSAMLTDTRLEDDLADLLWSFVNLFNRKIDRVERELDLNEQAQRRSQAEQDGSEVKSVALERLIEQGVGLIERRNAFEFFRDYAAELFAAATGSVWRPRAGGGSPHGAERIAACWADNRKVAQVVFKPDWARHRNAAPFKRNDQLLEALPIGVIVFPGSGISANLADKARKIGIPLWRFTADGPASSRSFTRRHSRRS
jgi:YspA, cpYpsA-related SLOG family